MTNYSVVLDCVQPGIEVIREWNVPEVVMEDIVEHCYTLFMDSEVDITVPEMMESMKHVLDNSKPDFLQICNEKYGITITKI